ncbi:Tetratricopeptide repeat (TPR)-like superfamily protein [Euphorbia peplus]|nr:Tetratricopeptide repeat (TPR)-like superfamily protein [Euphorbia peplus]
MALNKIEMAHQIYRDGKYEEALGFYTDALSIAKTKAQRISLHSNRAACYLKLHLFKEAAEECTSVLELDNKHAGALMLRAQTLVTLREYHSALFDVSRLMELNPSSEAYQNLETRLRTQLSLAPIPESEAELEEEEEEDADEGEGEEWSHEDEQENCEENTAMAFAETSPKTEPCRTASAEFAVPGAQKVNGSPEISKEPRKTIAAEVIAQAQRKVEPRKTLAAEVIAQARRKKESPEPQSKGWQTIPKPKGHSALDYARWDNVEDDSSEDEEDDDDDEESQPQYRFRVKTVGVRSVK